VFCAKSGGKSEIRKGPRGQYGVCRLPDGRGGGRVGLLPRDEGTRPLEPIPINWIAASSPRLACLT
jgi:putative hemolysin